MPSTSGKIFFQLFHEKMISASGEVGVSVMVELCQRVLDGKGMPSKWQTSALAPIFKEKGDVRNCNTYRGVKLFEHAMKIVERVQERRIRKLVYIDSMQFGVMPEEGRQTLFVVRRKQEEYRNKKKKLYMCFVDIKKAFDRVPRNVMKWVMRKKGLPEVIVRAVMSLYHGAKTKVRVGFELSQEFLVQVGKHQRSVLPPLLFAIAVDVISENARERLINEILYADDLALMSESMENLKEKFLKWKEAFESKWLKVNLIKTKVILSSSKGEVLKSKVDPPAKSGKRVMANSVMCTKCGKWIHGRCAKMKR